MIIGATSRSFEARVPFDSKLVCDLICAIRAQQIARFFFKIEISLGFVVAGGADPGILEHAEPAGVNAPGYRYTTKRKLELPKQRHTRSFACSSDQQSSAPRLLPL